MRGTTKYENDSYLEDNEYTSMLLPFLNNEEKTNTEEEKPREEKKVNNKTENGEKAPKISYGEKIEMLLSDMSPLEALKKKMMSDTAAQTEQAKPETDKENIKEEKQKEEKVEEKAEEKTTSENTLKEDVSSKEKIGQEHSVDETYAAIFKSIEEKVPKTEGLDKPVKRGSLLAKCLPYIYDEQGIKYEEEKPNYTLESVEKIIGSAEKAAEKKLEKLYGIKTNLPKLRIADADSLRNKQGRFKIGDKASDSKQENRRLVDSAPTIATTLFDDFSGKQTRVAADGSTVEIPVRLTNIQTDIPLVEDKTQVIPALRPEKDKTEIYEDILSHTKPINIKNVPGVTPVVKKKSTFSIGEVLPDEIVVDDYMSSGDAKRIGTRFKKSRRTAYLRFISTLIVTLITAFFATPLADFIYTSSPMAASYICFFATLVMLLINCNIFAGIKNAFSSRMDSSFPVAISGIVMLIYLFVQMVSGYNEPEHTVLFAVAILFYDYCVYKKQTVQLNGFKRVVKVGEKKAVALIDDPNATAHMSRSVIDGEVLAASTRRTNEIVDYVKHTSQDISFKGRLPIITAVLLTTALILSFIVGMSHSSFSVALCTFAVLTAFCAMPTLTLAEMLPFFKTAEKIYQSGGVLCSEASAGRIEESNAVVLNSADIFPKGCITLYNMKPLSANDIDKTLIEAAAVASAAKSPLFSVLRGIVGEYADLPTADTVQYEDNLGISGWVDDHHLHIGNRTLMESHGIRVPSLEIDKKILYRGYFPVYIASEQRACAMLMVKYEAEDEICNKLLSLQNTGMVLLVENCDPNITEEMLCDYCGLYRDSVKIMDHHGAAKHKEAVNFTESYSAHAFYKGGARAFLSIITGAVKLKKAATCMQALHIVCSVIALIVFAYLSLNGGLTVIKAATCLLIELASMIVLITGYLISGS